MCKNEYIWRKRLIHYQTTKFRLFQTERSEFADDNFEFDKNCGKFSKRLEKTVGKKKLLVLSNFSFSDSVFKLDCTADM